MNKAEYFRKYKVREYTPIYDTIEVIYSNPDGRAWKLLGKMKRDDFMKKYGNYWLYSVMDFHKTKTTSVAFGREEPTEKILFDESDN